MKNFIFCVMVLGILGCNSSMDIPKMQGTYLMTSQTVNDGKKDTRYEALKQLKIYTDQFMMYVQVNPADSISAFGVGTYTTGKATVTENVIYSASDSNFVSTPSTFKLEITKTPEGYNQLIPQIVTDSQKFKLTETYQKVGDTTATPLDGVWKQTQSYNLRGKDTLKNIRTQYKAFYNGYFMFGHTYTDSASKKKRTGIGFGTFVMNNKNKIRETDLNSTYSIIAGNSFDIDIEWTGTDHFKQTLQNADGTTGVEYYERLKK